MRLDMMNQRLKVKIPAEVFKSCPRCRKGELVSFEGEVFCLGCNWDSVDIHAEALALAQVYRQERQAVRVPAPLPVQPINSALIARLIQQPSQPEPGPDAPCPDAA